MHTFVSTVLQFLLQIMLTRDYAIFVFTTNSKPTFNRFSDGVNILSSTTAESALRDVQGAYFLHV